MTIFFIFSVDLLPKRGARCSVLPQQIGYSHYGRVRFVLRSQAACHFFKINQCRGRLFRAMDAQTRLIPI
jgi:hypothetical protein